MPTVSDGWNGGYQQAVPLPEVVPPQPFYWTVPRQDRFYRPPQQWNYVYERRGILPWRRDYVVQNYYGW